MTNDTLEIDLDELNDVSGGQSIAPPVLQLPSPIIKPNLPPPPQNITTQGQGMAPPKYSAGWWDQVRARGLFK